MHTLTIVFGTDAPVAHSLGHSGEDIEQNGDGIVRNFAFKTKDEADALLLGLVTAKEWFENFDYVVLDEEER
ncbi:hypothetical protein [Roseibium alexandrii]|uniref:Uncharacterized protein n=1 Tax=Roseibium alexandrii (strain DSM 17067 / NCIMB 14079 / DFL-11) TaxID=244592 RepID=A0A5E8GU66_ROSAD|nr:hypothetical protein [Roseibium alexandrii]EEE42872.1 hypothetical protein SADFL11_PLAS44 [Roseibium alexandrii DFL-11]